VNVENVGALVLSEINEEQVQAGVEVRETFTANIIKIEVDYKKLLRC
jgi:hypothetical protein